MSTEPFPGYKAAVQSFLYHHSAEYRAKVDAEIQHQKSVINVVLMLPGKYRYEQVEDALTVADTDPDSIYECLVAGNHTVALARFYEVLKGPQ